MKIKSIKIKIYSMIKKLNPKIEIKSTYIKIKSWILQNINNPINKKCSIFSRNTIQLTFFFASFYRDKTT